MTRAFRGRRTHPATGVSRSSRSRIAKRARAGKNVGAGNFNAVASKAAREYGSAKAGRRVAAAAMYKMARKYGVTKKGTIKKHKKSR